MTVDIAFLNGEVITVDKDQRIMEAVAIKGNRIAVVGSNEEVRKLIDDHTKVIDLQRRTLLPGFIDSHLHITMTGAKQAEINCKSDHINSIQDLYEEIRDKALKIPKGQWIRIWGFDEEKLIDRRFPTREELDQISTEHPIMIRRVCAHISVANSKGLELAGFDKNTPDPEGGKIEKNENGNLTGRLLESANMKMFKAARYTNEEIRKGLALASNRFLESGITSIHDAGGFGPNNFRIMYQAARSGDLRVRVYAMVSDVSGPSEVFIDKMIHAGISTGMGDDRFRIGPAKIFVDGAGETMATRKPHKDKTDYYGILYHNQEQMNKILLDAHKNGFQVTAHAIGDLAVEMMINGIENALKEYPREDHRHRIEHAEITEPDLLLRMKELGIIPVTNPTFFYEFGNAYIGFGEEYMDSYFPLRDFIDKGVIAAAGSDSAVTDYNPLFGIHSAVNRISESGQVVGSSQRISVLEAIKLFTWNGAYASFEENIKGSIEIGKLADLAVLDRSLLSTDLDEIKDVLVDMTILDGEIVHERKTLETTDKRL